MQRKRVEAWTAALRSGTYEQGMRTLRDEGAEDSVEYCCLGVLLETIPEFEYDSLEGHYKTADEELVNFYNTNYDKAFHYPVAEVFIEDEELPYWLLDHINMSDKDHQLLIKMNDTGKDFEAIADKIEELYLDDTLDTDENV